MRPRLLSRKFLGLWKPATYLCCCRCVTLWMAMTGITVFSFGFSAVIFVQSLVNIINQTWVTFLPFVLSLIGMIYSFLGLKGTSALRIREIRVFYYYTIIAAILSPVHNSFKIFPTDDEDVVMLFTILLLSGLLYIYSIYIIWSFLTRLQAGDIETIKRGISKRSRVADLPRPPSLNESVLDVLATRSIPEIDLPEYNHDANDQLQPVISSQINDPTLDHTAQNIQIIDIAVAKHAQNDNRRVNYMVETHNLP
mmetsp:Transcript_23688/g.26854  ORF Transcript_23688/g.26854 Transcript_23688/m.26854 type:complete len:253 (-) Transcript_23688:394-1152(-)